MSADLYSFPELWRHYRNCRRNKRNTNKALAFEVNAEENLLDLQRQLRDHTYAPGRSICFVTEGPKPREVFAADFGDRVMHHLLVDHLQKGFEPRFIHDSYACRPGKGTLAASDRLTEFLRRITLNGRRSAWFLKLDVASFFPSIHKQTLYEIIARQVRHPELLWLTRVLLLHDPTTDYEFRSRHHQTSAPGSGTYPIPGRKSLFGGGNERGLPIGNLTSQFWANVYLNELDQFVKRTLRCRYYLRYVDDLILLAEDPEQLRAWREQIAEFLGEHLRLDLREPGVEPTPVRCGVEFVGWKTWWNRRVVRRRTIAQLEARLIRFEQRALAAAWGRSAIALSPTRAQERKEILLLRSVIGSYGGHLQHGDAGREWRRVWARHTWLAKLFQGRGWRAVERWPLLRPLPQSRYSAQYRRLLRYAGDDALVFCQVGRFVEFYGPQRLLAQRVFQLIAALRPRAGFGFTVGFPVARSATYEQRALLHGFTVVHVRQGGAELGPARRSVVRMVVSMARDEA